MYKRQAGDGVRVVAAVFPRYRSIGRNLNKLELDLSPGRHGNIQKPCRIIRIKHGPDRGIPSRSPISGFYRVPREEDIVPGVGGRCVRDRKSNRDQLGGEDRELDCVGSRAGGVLQRNAVDSIDVYKRQRRL